MFKAIIFDIGRTLIGYNKPLSWSTLYLPALQNMADQCHYNLSEDQYKRAIDILTKYNTRIHPRIHEVSSTQIFMEILDAMHLPLKDLEQIKDCFYSFFRRDAFMYPEVEEALRTLVDKGILLATLSDVAYGMDNEYVMEDIAAIRKYIDFPFTSNDVGYRKPCAEGVRLLEQKMQADVSDIIFVGDEEKDIICANDAGAYSVLINRENVEKNYGQKREIRSLIELLSLVG